MRCSSPLFSSSHPFSFLFSSLLPPSPPSSSPLLPPPSSPPFLLPPFLPTHTAKVELEDIKRWPNTPSARRANTDKAADFLRKDGVMLHHDAVKGRTAAVKWPVFLSVHRLPSPTTPEMYNTFKPALKSNTQKLLQEFWGRQLNKLQATVIDQAPFWLPGLYHTHTLSNSGRNLMFSFCTDSLYHSKTISDLPVVILSSQVLLCRFGPMGSSIYNRPPHLSGPGVVLWHSTVPLG